MFHDFTLFRWSILIYFGIYVYIYLLIFRVAAIRPHSELHQKLHRGQRHKERQGQGAPAARLHLLLPVPAGGPQHRAPAAVDQGFQLRGRGGRERRAPAARGHQAPRGACVFV